MAFASSTRGDHIQNVAWLSDWEGPYEGPMSIALKFGWANCLNGQEVCQTLFGRKLVLDANSTIHGRTFLAPRWMRRDELKSGPLIARTLVTRGLDRYTANWFGSIASDLHMRFCPACLVNGYQTVLFQIDSLAKCPIHGEPLQDTCVHCGSPTPRYALTGKAFDQPFHCPVCGKVYGGAFSPSSWKAEELHRKSAAVLDPLVKWLEKLEKSKLKWWQWSDWFGPALDAELEKERRLATFDALSSIIPFHYQDDCLRSPLHAIQVYAGNLIAKEEHYRRIDFYDVLLTEEQIQRRLCIYKSIRRYAQKRLAGCFRTMPAHNADTADIQWVDEVLSLSLHKCVKAQCLLLWRMRFEDASSFSKSGNNQYPGLRLRPAALNWPWSGSADESAWAGYVLTSFNAAIEVANEWFQRAQSLPDADIYGSKRVPAMTLYMEFSPLFSPSKFPVFPHITMILGPPKRHSLDQALFVVGPHALSDDYKALPSCPDQIRCAKCSQRRLAACEDKSENRTRRSEWPTGASDTDHRQVDLPHRDPAISILPLERLELPIEFDGTSGPYRIDVGACLIPAHNDLEAIQLWFDALRLKGLKENTCRIYLHHAERCLLWAVSDRHKPLSAIDENDAAAFANFLVNPTPYDRWICAGIVTRTSGKWRPFKAALSARSRNQAIKILATLFNWLQANRYINFNPWTTTPYSLRSESRRAYAPMTAIAPQKATIILADEWHYITLALGKSPNDVDSCRAKALMYLAYFCALRPAELTALTLGMFQTVASHAGKSPVWILTIPGRKSERSFIYVLPPVQEAVSAYLISRGLFPNPSDNLNNISLLAKTSWFLDRREEGVCKEGLTRNELSRLAKRIYAAAAGMARDDGNMLVARRLEEANLIWLSNAFEIYVTQSDISGNWPWILLGARKTVPEAVFGYLPDRSEVPLDTVRSGIEKLQSIWMHS